MRTVGSLAARTPQSTLLDVTMNWLTREWASGALEDDEWRERWEQYVAHNREVLPRLSNGAERLLRDINLHDAQIRFFEQRPANVLAIGALIGDLQVGYESIELRFVESRIRLEPGSTLDSLKLLDSRTQILYDEVDIEADGLFVHRVLLSPRGEYEVVFSSLTEHREPADRSARR